MTVFNANVYCKKLNMSHEDWLASRRHGIGGSDASGIVGMNAYSTPYTVWADKTGRLLEQEDNEAMRQGRDLEDYVAKRFEEVSGKKTKNCNYILQHPTHNFMLANVDRLIVGEKAGLECKTTSLMNLKKFKGGEFPENYYAQCVHYLAVTGAERWYLGVLVLNQGFYWFTIERDEGEIQALIDVEKKFWENHVVKDIPPAVDGLEPTSEAINSIFKADEESEEVQLTDISVLDNYIAIKSQIKALEQEKEKCEQIIKEQLATAVKGYCGDYEVTWKPQKRTTFDHKRYASDNANINLASYYKVSESRPFKVVNKSN